MMDTHHIVCEGAVPTYRHCDVLQKKHKELYVVCLDHHSSSVKYLLFLCPQQSLTQLICSYEAENQTRYLVCDLGNPMKSGASVRADNTHMLPLDLICLSTI